MASEITLVLPDTFTLHQAETALRSKLARMAMELSEGHHGNAASLLGIHRNTLTRLLQLNVEEELLHGH